MVTLYYHKQGIGHLDPTMAGGRLNSTSLGGKSVIRQAQFLLHAGRTFFFLKFILNTVFMLFVLSYFIYDNNVPTNNKRISSIKKRI